MQDLMKFFDQVEALKLETLLKHNGIESKIEILNDQIAIYTPGSVQYIVKVKPEDYDQAYELLEELNDNFGKEPVVESNVDITKVTLGIVLIVFIAYLLAS